MSDKARILVVDDHSLFREGVIHALNGQSDLVVIGEAGSGEEAYALVSENLPDIVLMDIMMQGEGGIRSTQRIITDFPIVKVIMLTVSEDEDDLMDALKAGARGYVLKGVSAQELADGVRIVASGDVFISPTLASGILFEMTHSKPDPINQLTKRERQILSLVSEGLTNREIGEKLHLAEKTIKHYMTNVLQKLQVRSRIEAALLAQERKLKGKQLD